MGGSMRRGITFAVATLLTGCAFAPLETIVDTASDYNIAVEKAKNEMYLVNIVRASERRPMYFTSISTLRGSMQSVISTGNLPIPFGGGNHNAIYAAGPSVNYTANPSFDLGVQDSKPFWQGITTPVPVTTLKYYLEQGWPGELVLFLLVRKIEFDRLSFVNYPENPDEMAAFRYVLESFFGCRDEDNPGGCDVHFEEAPPDAVGRALEKNEIGNLKSLVAASKEGLKLVSTDCEPDKYQLVGKAGALHIASVFSLGDVLQALEGAKQKLCVADGQLNASPPKAKPALDTLEDVTRKLEDATKQLCALQTKLGSKELKLEVSSFGARGTRIRDDLERWKEVVEANRNKARNDLKPAVGWECPNYKGTHAAGSIDAATRMARSGNLRGAWNLLKDTQELLAAVSKKMGSFCIGTTAQSACNAKVYLRSPEAILYYLGELVRTGGAVKIQYCKIKDSPQNLFYVMKGSEVPKGAVLAVTYEGTKYFIPKDESTDGCKRNLATEALTLVTQLFAQQTDSTQAPATGAVTIVGPLPPR